MVEIRDKKCNFGVLTEYVNHKAGEYNPPAPAKNINYEIINFSNRSINQLLYPPSISG
jgi:hypothetical protein